MNQQQQFAQRIEDIMRRLGELKRDLEAQGASVSVGVEVKPETSIEDDGDRSLEAFKRMIQRGNYVVLDTETTGLERGEIVQIAVIDSTGNVLLDTLVKPVGRIPADASAIHGLTDADVASAPRWADVSAKLLPILTGKDVVIYNAVYDRKMMHQAAEAAGLPKVDWKQFSRFWCAMEAFAEVFGDWNEYRHSYRWQKLTTAANYYSLPVLNAHTALGDCLMTLAVCKRMAGLE
jgi:DNA polymerase-3 subunit epsilon